MKGEYYGNECKKKAVKKGLYYLSKHRRLELEHFCAQYCEWKEEYFALEGFATSQFHDSNTNYLPDPTAKTALRAANLREKMEMVEKTAAKIDISDEIFEAVTKERTYVYFEARDCGFGRDLFYDRLRKFYYLLDKIRN